MFHHFVLTTKTTQPNPRSSQLTVQFSGNYAAQSTSFFNILQKKKLFSTTFIQNPVQFYNY